MSARFTPILLWLALACAGDALAEPSPRDAPLPSGWSVTRRVDLPADQVRDIGRKLGAELVGISNDVWSIGGFAVQVNVVSAADEAAAKVCHATLEKRRGPGFTGRRGVFAVEIAGTNRLAAARVLAHLELLSDDPRTYSVRARIACVDDVDYMTANRVFNHMIELDRGGALETIEPLVRALTKDWTPGRSARLLTEERDWFSASHAFQPEPTAREPEGATTRFVFAEPPQRLGIPYVTVAATIRVRSRFAPVEIPGDEGSTAATRFWPARDPSVIALATRLTADLPPGREQVAALLRYVSLEIAFAGETGSRYGVLDVLEQRRGHCFDKSDLLVTLCRARGIPARQVAGWVPAMASGHVWTEVRIPGQGWLPIDATTTWFGISADYVPLYRTSDGHMPIVYLGMPEVTIVE